MGVMSVRKCHTAISKSNRESLISTNNESDDKVVNLQKMAACVDEKEAVK